LQQLKKNAGQYDESVASSQFIVNGFIFPIICIINFINWNFKKYKLEFSDINWKDINWKRYKLEFPK
jgi:hypothetical protein